MGSAEREPGCTGGIVERLKRISAGLLSISGIRVKGRKPREPEVVTIYHWDGDAQLQIPEIAYRRGVAEDVEI